MVGRAYLLEKGAPPSSDLSRASRSSSVIARCERKARERLKKSMEALMRTQIRKKRERERERERMRETDMKRRVKENYMTYNTNIILGNVIVN